MTITKIAAFACGIFLFFSCSSLQQTGLFGSGKRVVAAEQNISLNPAKHVNAATSEATKTIPAPSEVRTLLD